MIKDMLLLELEKIRMEMDFFVRYWYIMVPINIVLIILAIIILKDEKK